MSKLKKWKSLICFNILNIVDAFLTWFALTFNTQVEKGYIKYAIDTFGLEISLLIKIVSVLLLSYLIVTFSNEKAYKPTNYAVWGCFLFYLVATLLNITSLVLGVT